MISTALSLIALAGLGQTAAAAAPPKIGPGSLAPAIDVKYWVKGKEVKAFSDRGTYVVEFWATWCGPCIEAIPHVTKLAKEHTDVTFIGVGIWEPNPDKRVEKFVEKMGAKMDYNVAYGGEKDAMAQTWMQASGSRGIPTAFIIKDRVIQWIGHPMEMDPIIPQVKSGKWDLKKFADAYNKEQADQAKLDEVMESITAAQELYKEGKTAEAKRKLSEIEKENAKNEEVQMMVRKTKLVWLAQEDPKGFDTATEKLLKDEDWSFPLGQVAMMLAETPKTAKLAETFVTRLMNAREDIWFFYVGVEVFEMTKNEAARKDAAKRALAMMDKNRSSGDEELYKMFKAAAG